MTTIEIITGDYQDVLLLTPAWSVDLAFMSPPYPWTDGQRGKE